MQLSFLLLILAHFAAQAAADIYLYGARHEVVSNVVQILCLAIQASLAINLRLPASSTMCVPAAQPHYGYGYVGLDWPEEYATCSGSRQSPINVPGHAGEACNQQ